MPASSALRARARLLAGFGAMLALTVLVGAFALRVMDGLNDRTAQLTRDTVPHLATAGRLGADIHEYRLTQFRHLAERHAAHRAEAARKAAAIREGIDARLRADRSAAGSNDDAVLTEVEALWDRYADATLVALEPGPAAGTRPRAEAALAAGEGLFRRLQASLRGWKEEEEEEATEALAESGAAYRRARTLLVALLVSGASLGGVLALWLLVVRPMRQRAATERHEGRLARALEMAESEAEAMHVVARALDEAAPGRPSELLLADSSQSHLRRALAAGPGGTGPGCPVTAPHSCAAVRRGQTTVFPSSDALDACPKLRDREGGARSAVCVPITVLGRAVGVLHATGVAGRRPDETELARLEGTATQAGARLGVMRVMLQTQLQAATDPLTGLLNRRSLEDRVHELQQDGGHYALALLDLDRFKRLNDTYGHETGDRALRLFARTLAGAVRSEDVVARYGGEEFVVLLPRCDARTATEVLDRARESLREALALAEVPAFTVSAGLAESAGRPFDRVVAAADAALFAAKDAGRDRVVVAGALAAPPSASPVGTSAPELATGA